MRRNGFLTFCFAMVPGCGQMYQGYMKRGFSLLLWFCGIIALSVLIRVEFILVMLPVIWAYSFFDTFNIRALSPEQRAAFGDNFIPSAQWLGERGITGLTQSTRFSKLAGWGCIILGALILYGIFWDTVYSWVWNYFPWLGQVLSNLPALAIAVVVILLGVRMLRSGFPAKRDDDDTTFGGGSF